MELTVQDWTEERATLRQLGSSTYRSKGALGLTSSRLNWRPRSSDWMMVSVLGRVNQARYRDGSPQAGRSTVMDRLPLMVARLNKLSSVSRAAIPLSGRK